MIPRKASLTYLVAAPRTYNRIRSPRQEASGLMHERKVREVGKFDPHLWKKDWLYDSPCASLRMTRTKGLIHTAASTKENLTV